MSKADRLLRPTRRQKEIISSFGFKAENFLICGETENTITIYNKHTGKCITRYKKENSK